MGGIGIGDQGVVPGIAGGAGAHASAGRLHLSRQRGCSACSPAPGGFPRVLPLVLRCLPSPIAHLSTETTPVGRMLCVYGDHGALLVTFGTYCILYHWARETNDPRRIAQHLLVGSTGTIWYLYYATSHTLYATAHTLYATSHTAPSAFCNQSAIIS